MTEMLHLADERGLKSHKDELNELMADIKLGLAKSTKQIQSKYFYDPYGSALFNQITRHPDYYLTNCEIEILQTYKSELSAILHTEAFNLIELGPGEGIKTQILMKQFMQDGLIFRYTPIDISATYLQILTQQLEEELPKLKLMPIHADYFKGLEWQSEHSERRNLVLFLGSSIGNYDHAMTLSFLKHLWEVLHHGDFVLIGFDLRKDVDILMRAYNDSDGLTREFNLNLLKRINRELQADFDLNKFQHYGTYNVHSGAMESYLISLEKQTVNIAAIGQSFHFEAIEPIHVEYSHKYLLNQIADMANVTGFNIIKNFLDSNNYFVDSLWQVIK